MKYSISIYDFCLLTTSLNLFSLTKSHYLEKIQTFFKGKLSIRLALELLLYARLPMVYTDLFKVVQAHRFETSSKKSRYNLVGVL